MKFIILTRGSERYFLAEQILEFAQQHGFKPHISTDGRLHCSSMCNRYMHQVLGNQALRLKYNLNQNSMIRIIRDEKSELFLQRVASALGKSLQIVSSGKLNLYSYDAFKAILTVTTQKPDITLGDEDFDVIPIPDDCVTTIKTVETKKQRNIVSIFGRK